MPEKALENTANSLQNLKIIAKSPAKCNNNKPASRYNYARRTEKIKNQKEQCGAVMHTSGLFLGILLIICAPFAAFGENAAVYTIRSVSFKITGYTMERSCAKRPISLPVPNLPLWKSSKAISNSGDRPC
jgi:hypothetical protein